MCSRAVTVGGGEFSGEISDQSMIDPGRYEVEDSDGGGLDGRWWLTKENRRLEASVAGNDRGLFPARWGRENDENHRGFSLQQGRNLSVVVRRFSGEISGQPMVDPGRSDVKDSYGGGLDGRWWLMSENRRLEASVAADDHGPFPAKWGG